MPFGIIQILFNKKNNNKEWESIKEKEGGNVVIRIDLIELFQRKSFSSSSLHLFFLLNLKKNA